MALVQIEAGKDENGKSQTKEVDTIISVNGRDYDALAALPFSVGDWRKLKGKTRVDITDLAGKIDLELMCNIVLALLEKLVPGAKLADVETMPLGRLSDLVGLIVQGERIDRPT